MILLVGLLLIISINVTHSISLPLPVDVETHTFRWSISSDLNNTICAFPNTPWLFSNDSLHSDPKRSKRCGDKILLGEILGREDNRIICQNNNSLFMLIGNPGIIWHPLSGQCISTKIIDGAADWMYATHAVVHMMDQILITSDECDMKNSEVAVFKYDKNKPQRLTFVKNNSKTGEKEEWCIRQWQFIGIHVVSKCDYDPLSYHNLEPFFHEIF